MSIPGMSRISRLAPALRLGSWQNFSSKVGVTLLAHNWIGARLLPNTGLTRPA
jgi:hypothetical protein